LLNNNERYYVVRESILPEALVKTVEAKELLAKGAVKTVHEAVELAGISRSAYYKYKDGIESFVELQTENIVTISLDLDHRSGILSEVLSLVAKLGGNVLTISQTIPLHGVANVVISVDISHMKESAHDFLHRLKAQGGVGNAQIVGRG